MTDAPPRLRYAAIPAEEREEHPCSINRAPFPIYSAAWLAGDLLVIAGGGGKAGSGVSSGLVVCRVAGEEGARRLVPLGTVDSLNELVYHVAASPSGRELSCAVGGANYLFAFGADGEARQRAAWAVDAKEFESFSRFSRDGAAVVTGGEDRVVRLWAARGGAGRLLRETGGGAGGADLHADDIIAADVSADGALVASTAAGPSLKVWDAATGALARELRSKHGGKALEFRSCRFAVPGGENSAAGGGEVLLTVMNVPPRGPGLLGVWDAATGACLQQFKLCDSPLVQAEVSSSGRYFAAATSDASVFVYELGDDARLRLLCSRKQCHDLPSTGLSFSPDESAVVSASPDRSVVFLPLRRQAGCCDSFARVLVNLVAALVVAAVASQFSDAPWDV